MLPVSGSPRWREEESVTHDRGEQTIPSKAAINTSRQEQLGDPSAKNLSILEALGVTLSAVTQAPWHRGDSCVTLRRADPTTMRGLPG